MCTRNVIYHVLSLCLYMISLYFTDAFNSQAASCRYEVHTTMVAWDEAVQVCKHRSKTLVKIDDEKELSTSLKTALEAAKSIFSDDLDKSRYWVGLQKYTSTGAATIHWGDCQHDNGITNRLSVSNSNNGYDTACGLISDLKLKFVDECNLNRRFICENTEDQDSCFSTATTMISNKLWYDSKTKLKSSKCASYCMSDSSCAAFHWTAVSSCTPLTLNNGLSSSFTLNPGTTVYNKGLIYPSDYSPFVNGLSAQDLCNLPFGSPIETTQIPTETSTEPITPTTVVDEIEDISSSISTMESSPDISSIKSASTSVTTVAIDTETTGANREAFSLSQTSDHVQTVSVSTTSGQQPVTSHITEQQTSHDTEPLTSSSTQPLTSPATEPLISHTTEPLTISATEPQTNPATKPLTGPTTEPIISLVTETLTSSAIEPFTRSASEPLTSSATEPLTNSATESLKSPTTKALTSSATITPTGISVTPLLSKSTSDLSTSQLPSDILSTINIQSSQKSNSEIYSSTTVVQADTPSSNSLIDSSFASQALIITTGLNGVSFTLSTSLFAISSQTAAHINSTTYFNESLIIDYGVCQCTCINSNVSVQHKIDYRNSKLKLETSTPSSYKRKHICAEDHRQSSVFIGVVGVVVIVSVCGSIIFIDASNLIKVSHKKLNKNVQKNQDIRLQEIKD